MSGTGHRLLPANITLLQPGSRGFRLSDALSVQAVSAQTSNTQIATLQGQVNGVQGDVTTLQGQVAALQGQVAALQTFMSSFSYYQNIEQPTGTYFLDSRLIYKSSFVINGALNTALTNTVYPHGVLNINYIVNIQAMAAQAQGQQLPITFLNMVTAPSMSTGISIWADTTNIIVSVGSQAFANFQVLATLWYTATDR